jgi:hypothetical protein
MADLQRIQSVARYKNTSAAVIQAAIAGSGVALGRKFARCSDNEVAAWTK